MTHITKPSIDQPPFLVGAEVSGTTLLRLMLDHHPRIAWINEFEYTVDRVGSNGTWPDLTEYYEWLQTHRIFRASGFHVDHTLSYPSLVKSFMAQKQIKSAKEIIGATVHGHFDRVLNIWPEAKFIHLVRDGRDVARSCIGMGWAGNVYTGVERWIEAERLWESLQGQLPRERIIELKFEELIRDPKSVLTRICRFIGVECDRRMLDYPQDTTYAAPDATLVEQWRRKLSEYEIQLLESRIGDMLAARGYELSGLPSIRISDRAEGRLRRQDRWARRRFGLNRYGLWLYLASVLSRRLRVRSWERRVRLRLNAIDVTHLK